MLFIVALAVALSVVFQALGYVFFPTRQDRELRRAFEALAEEFDDLRDTVRSGLGRISRLKRSTMEASASTGEPENPDIALGADGNSGFPGLTPTQRTMQARILSRRHKGVN